MKQLLVTTLLLTAPLLAQGPDRAFLKSGRVLVGTIESDRVDVLRFADDELGVVRVPRTALRTVHHGDRPADALGIEPPDDPGDRPATYIRWQRPTDSQAGGLQTGTGRWYHEPSDTTLFLVGVVHVGDPAYFGELQKVLDGCDLVLFEGVGRGDATDEDLARMDVMMRMQLALRGALGLGFQKDHLDYARSFWVNSDVEFREVLRELEARGAGLPTDNPVVQRLLKGVLAAAQGGGRRDRRLQETLKSQMGPVLAQADAIMQRPGFAGLRGAIIEHRNGVVLEDLDRELANGPRGRRVAIFYGAGHLPDMDRRLLERGLEFQGSVWHTAWRVDKALPGRLRAVRGMDSVVRDEIDAHGDPGLEVSVWIGGDGYQPYYTWESDVIRAAASSIKTAYMVELFAEFEGRLDEPLPGLDEILEDRDHPALVHFDEAQRTEIVAALRGASVRRIAQMMIHGVGVSNVVYNSAANVVTAVLGGPDGLSARLRARWGDGGTVRRYMLADRDVTGDNEVTASFLARVLGPIARGELRGLREETVQAMRDQLFTGVDAARGRHHAKSGALDTDPMTRIQTGYFETPAGERVVYVVMCQRADPGSRARDDAVTAVSESNDRLTGRVLDALLAEGR